MADEEEWYLEEEGCLQFSGRPTSVTFSPTSNCFISTLEDGAIEVVDARSGLRLKRTTPSGSSGQLQCKFCPEVEKLFITNGKASGLRKDLNGVLLLESILQPQISISDQAVVVLELSFQDALQLLSALDLCMPQEEVVFKPMQALHTQLKEEVEKAKSLVNSSHDKSAKWYTCQVKQVNTALTVVFNRLVGKLQKNPKNSTALPVVSALLARMMNFQGKANGKKPKPVEKIDMFVEALRQNTFLSWPHKEYRWAYPEAMAKAGFYHQPSNSGDDRALCFTCNVCLVCWEPTDEPWSEHERHSPDCPFVRGDHTENVPMAVSLATGPGQSHEAFPAKLISESSCSLYLATCSGDGQVMIWNIQEQLKIHSQFQVDLPSDLKPSSGCNKVPSSEPPTSFVAWTGPEDGDGAAGVSVGDAAISSAITTSGINSAEGTTGTAAEKFPDDQGNENYSEVSGLHGTKEQVAKEGVYKLDVTALTIVCSCGKECSYSTDRKYQTRGHTATLVLAVSVTRETQGGNSFIVSDKDRQRNFGPYILVYSILPELNLPTGVINDQNLGTMDIDKDLLLQDPFSPSGSEDDWYHEPMLLPPPHSLHSSVLQKFAEAISGEETDTADKTDKCTEESIGTGKIVQCFEVSNVIDAQCYEVTQIVPLGNGEQLLVCIHFCETCHHQRTCEIPKVEDIDEIGDASSEARESSCSGEDVNPNSPSHEHRFKECIVVVYEVITNNGERTLSQQPTRFKQYLTLEGVLTSVVALPVESYDFYSDVNTASLQEDEDEEPSSSQFLVAAVKNNIVIIESSSLNVLAKFSTSNENSSCTPFTHVLNCPGMDVLCACTDDGNMRFLSLRHQLAGGEYTDGVGEDKTDASLEKPTAGPLVQSDKLLDYPVTLECLHSLIRLTEYATLTPSFTASVPSSWIEVHQDQQHLHQRNLGHPGLLSRTWKLYTEDMRKQAKEQVVELLLPKNCQQGHVDVRFSLKPKISKSQSTTSVYLLKSPCPMLRKPCQRSAAHRPAKNKILATAREQGNILCGPVSLKSGLDSSGQFGRVVLTSPELIKTTSRVLSIVFESSGTSDDLAEVSVAVTRFKNNLPTDWRFPRSSLLEDISLRRGLLDICCEFESVQGITRLDEGKMLALELLCWIGVACMYSDTGEKSFVDEVEEYLPSLVRKCFLQCGRSIAHRCSRLLMICGRQMIEKKNSLASESVSFRSTLLNAILDVLPDTVFAASSGALQWLFKLLTGVAAQADPATASSRCLELLERFSSRLAATAFPEHLVLQAKYGLYGCPLDPVLFDAMPKTFTSEFSSPNIASGNQQPSRSSTAVGTDSEVYSSVDASWTYQGLLEVQPLHFVCSSTSDGARVEKGDVSQPPGGTSVSGGIPPHGQPQPSLPTTASLAVLEQELQLLKMQQHQQHLVSLQQTKQQLEQHKKDLEDLSMWPLFPKLWSKVEGMGSGCPSLPPPLPPQGPFSGPSQNLLAHGYKMKPTKWSQGSAGYTTINLAQQKKLTSSPKKQDRPTSTSFTQPLQQHLMQLPQPQILVIDRLHSGARHHVLLDFGCVVQLTDILIPQCSDISVLSIDIFTHLEDQDVGKIAVVSDINRCAFVLKDLLPPPLCRYIKLTVVGRLKNNSKARVKIGEFYGHPLCSETVAKGQPSPATTDGCYDHHCLPILRNLLEDIHCRYNLSCTQLRALLQSCGPKNPRTEFTVKGEVQTEDERKVRKAYSECMNLQHQLNLVEHSINRLIHSSTDRTPISSLDQAKHDHVKHDHVRVVCDLLVNTVVALMALGPSSKGFFAKPKLTLEWHPWLSEVTPNLCETLFRNLCVHDPPQLREKVGTFLLNSCGRKPWWGEFLVGVLKEFFSSSQSSLFPRERLFVVLVSLSQCSPSTELVLTSFLTLLDEQLPFKNLTIDVPSVDLTLIGWLLLLMAHVLDTCMIQNKPPLSKTADTGDNTEASGNSNGKAASPSKTKTSKAVTIRKTLRQSRWNFMLPMPVGQAAGSASESGGYRLLSRHKPLPKKATSDSTSQGILKGYVKPQYSFKHVKDLVKLRRKQHEDPKTDAQEGTSQSVTISSSILLSSSTTVPVIRKMISFILNVNSDCNVDLFLIICKVIAHLAFTSDPRVCLSDVATDKQVERLLRMCAMPTSPGYPHWGGAWAVHSLTSLLQDLLQGEKGVSPCDNQNSPAQANEPLKSETEIPVAPVSESKDLPSDTENGDSMDDLYEIDVDESHAPAWLTEFGEAKFVPRPTAEKPGASVSSTQDGKLATGSPSVKMSSAIDIRLEFGLEMEAEQDLKMLEHLQADAITKALNLTLSPSSRNSEPPRRQVPRNGQSILTESTLQSSFRNIFSDCSNPDVDVASLLHLWLSVQQCIPGLKLDVSCLSKLLLHLDHQPQLSNRSQQLCYQVLSAVCEGQMKTVARSELTEFIQSKELLSFVVKSLLQTPSSGSHFHPPSTKLVKKFLSSLQSAIEGNNSADLFSHFQNMLLQILLELSTSKRLNRAVSPCMAPITSFILENPETLQCQGNQGVVLKLVGASLQLVLDHLTYRKNISLVPSSHPDIHSSAVSDAIMDKLDDSDWLVQLLFMVIQIVQNSPRKESVGETKPPDTCSAAEAGNQQTLEQVVGDHSLKQKELDQGLAETLVQRKEPFMCMLQCLDLCSADSARMLFKTTLLTQEDNPASEVLGSEKPASVEDGILQLLCTVQNQVADRRTLVDGILWYLQRTCRDELESRSLVPRQLSEPLLWLIMKCLDTTQAVALFHEKGGLEIVCQAIVSEQTPSLDLTPSGLLPVMQELAVRTNNTRGEGKTTAEAEWTKPTINFAPHGTISCSSLATNRPDALLKATAPHRRARTAAWSYGFTQDEEWCELVVSLPTAILLSDVHIQPHSTGLATCPSHVALDISIDRKVLVPVCGPVLTTGISVIKLRLQQPQIAQHIHIHCHRPRDSHVLGLAQIRVYGTSLFGSQNTVNQLLHKAKPQGASFGWVRLLSHCLAEGPDLHQILDTPTPLLTNVFHSCTTLLLLPQSGIFSWCVELVLMKLSVQFPELGTLLIKHLLRGSNGEEKKRIPVANMASVELIYQLGRRQDAAFQDRLAVMSSWLESIVSQDSSAAMVATSGHFQAVAAVIWASKNCDIESAVKQHFTEKVFRSLFHWSKTVSGQDALKRSVDHLIGALSYTCPSYYDLLLELTGVKALVNRPGKKEAPSSPLSNLLSSRSQLATLARASQSHVTGQLLLESRLLELLVEQLARFCYRALFESQNEGPDRAEAKLKTGSSEFPSHKGYGITVNLLPQLLNFLSCCCQEPSIKDWMGDGGYQFWYPLLSVLSKGGEHYGTSLLGSSYERFAIETATVELFCKCIHCHPRNQEKMASLLCDIIENQNSVGPQTSQSAMKISGFMRQLILRMLLREEKLTVCLRLQGNGNLHVSKEDGFSHHSEWHPSFGAGHSFMLFSASWSSTLQSVSDQVLFPFVDKKTVDSVPEDKTSKPTAEGSNDLSTDFDDLYNVEGFEFLESVSLAAGFNVKSKRAEKTESAVAKESKAPASESKNQPIKASCFFYHSLLGDAPLPRSLTLAQLLSLLMTKGVPAGTSCIELVCKSRKDDRQGDETLLQVVPLLSPLEVFAKQNGLSQLSVHLPSHVILPESVTPSSGEERETIEDDCGSRWLSYPTRLPLPLVSLPASVLTTVPAHSLVAFGLFIQLPRYDKVLLQDRLRARYLLRLLLGAKQDSEGGSILSSPVANSLSTLPFQVLRTLFQSSVLSAEEGGIVRTAALEIGAIQMVLLCLAVLSHHQPQTLSGAHKLALQALSTLTGSLCRDGDVGSANERNYWAKGTGFGTGSTSSGWDVEQAMLKQRAEEEHVTCLLQVLASYITPFGARRDSAGDQPTSACQSAAVALDSLSDTLLGLLTQSCLIPTLSSYLRNDSVLDMARHIPLYQAVLELLRAVASCPALLPLLLPQSKGSSQESMAASEMPSIASLLEKMKQCVDTYSKTLRSTQGKKEEPAYQFATEQASNSGQEPQRHASAAEERKDLEAEGLALLIPDIQETAKLMQKVVQEFHEREASSSSSRQQTGGSTTEASAEKAEDLSKEERYLATIRPLQFGTHRIVVEKEDGKLQFDSGGYHFSSSVRSAVSGVGSGGMVRARRLAQEVSSLATSLPLSCSSSVCVRCDKERLDVMKVLITGPSDTPYANGCFEFDVYFPQNYPESPMYVNFETTGHHSVRFNPNLYNDGKVCLSILNTWHGRPEEKWNPQNSSFLQVLVSIQSLILVHEPYFNEPGYERSRGTPAGQQNSREYDANICQATVRWAMLEQLRKPSPCFKQVIQAHFYLKKDEILEQCERWIKETESLVSGRPVGRAISHHVQSLKQNTALLKEELNKLTEPPEHKDDDSEDDSD